MYCMIFIADCLQVYMYILSYSTSIESEQKNKANSCSNETVSGDQKNSFNRSLSFYPLFCQEEAFRQKISVNGSSY